MSPPQETSSSSATAAATTTTADATTSFDNKKNNKRKHSDQDEACLQAFCRFLQFETVSSLAPTTGAYKDCAAWLVTYLQQTLPFLDSVEYLAQAPDHSPVVIAIWKGLDESLPVLLLNSHYDVVPADPKDWTMAAPFEAKRSSDGKIYGRGTQDMKCVCLQYIQALERIHQDDPTWKPARNVVLSFVPDEEVGGSGMAAFLDSSFYQNLPGEKIALALDEGLASTTDSFSVFYGERLPWWVSVKATGPTGHGSRFIDNTAVEQIIELSKRALEFRSGQRSLLGLDDHSNCAHAVAAKKKKTLGDVTSLNITTLQAGVQVGDTYAYNCVPPTASCSLDIRISPHMEPAEMKSLLDTWCQECSAGENTLQWGFVPGQNGSSDNDLSVHAVTSTDKTQNAWYAVFADTLESAGYQITPQVFPAATDSRFLRALGVRALGFSPMRLTEIMLHENDEYIPEHTYLEGIRVYQTLLKSLASQGKEMEQAMEQLPN